MSDGSGFTLERLRGGREERLGTHRMEWHPEKGAEEEAYVMARLGAVTQIRRIVAGGTGH